ncbi:NUDIX hydrolase [Nonomuraea turcica]|uniref:NUDIX hydrolase n=1 Tax=Nonomuraea sp. G32 TaxID=3067274 RepID=UPI00273B18BB|nr:NUDIX domain-containing protein [Nonomuraea sp. G32]MDP4507018.1 NUDIX domain-containing protein [Nonomuraea sp. G32]
MVELDQRHSVSVAGVVVDDAGRALLTRRADNGEWQAPGGILQIGETIMQGVCREVSEETGLIVEPLALTGIYKNMARGIVALVFRCTATGGRLSINDEVTAFHWASEEDIRDMVSEAFAVRILDALHEGTPAIRHHDGVRLI